MNNETNDKIETIIISCVNRLFDKEANVGLDIDDLKILEILYKIGKDSKSSSSSNPISAPNTPEDLIELLRTARGSSDDHKF